MIWLIGIALYIFIGSVFATVTWLVGEKHCSNTYHDPDCGHFWVTALGSTFWPAALPVAAGILVGATTVKGVKKVTSL